MTAEYVYIVMSRDSCWDHGDPKLIAAYLDLDEARQEMFRLQETKDRYTHYYTTCVHLKGKQVEAES